jgi:hypothetical protein
LDEYFSSLKRQPKGGHQVTEAEEKAIILLSPLAELGNIHNISSMQG